jgi:kumamolisin
MVPVEQKLGFGPKAGEGPPARTRKAVLDSPVKLAGSERGPVLGARAMGPAQRSAPVDVTVVLRRRRDVAGLPPIPEFGGDARRPRPFLSREELAARHGAHPADLESVRRFALDRGLTILSESAIARSVRMRGSVAAMESAFGTRLQRWVHAGGTYRGRTGALELPDALGGAVIAVLGLDDRPQAVPHFRRRKSPQPGDASYTPPVVANAYGFPGGYDGSGQTIALIELGGGYSLPDLTKFFAGVSIKTPSVTAVSVDGATNSPTGSPDGPDGEVELDIEVAGAVAPGARFLVYFAPNTDAGFLDAVSAVVHASSPIASLASISWGGPEDTWTAQARTALDAVFEDAAALGISVTVAAGDGGATDGGAAGVLTVDFPASSPNVLACGGTRLLLRGGAIASEVVWNDLSNGEGATGGGVSQAFPRPAYQSGAPVPDAPDGFVGRGVPDVAGSADPADGYAVRVDGQGVVMGGTSAVAPLWAGLIARINEARGRSLGLANTVLYPKPISGTFRDITQGNNGGYSAGAGWDPCTGWGSPNGARLLAALTSELG